MKKTAEEPRVVRQRTVLVAGIGLAVAVAAALVVWRPWNVEADAPNAPLITQARQALERGEYDQAEHLATKISRGDESWVAGQLVAGEAAMKSERFEAAFDYFRSIPRDGSSDAVTAALSTAEVARHLGYLSEAELAYRDVLERVPDHVAAHERMAFLLGVTGRRWESQSHFLFLIRSGAVNLYQLALVGDLERPMEQGDYLRQCAEKAPDDLLVKLGLAFHAVAEGRAREARGLLREVVAEAPEIVAAQAMLGELLVDAEDEAFAAWHAGLPSAADDSADIWYVRGLWARRHNELSAATRCFWETVRRAPSHRRGSYQLGQVLIAQDDEAGHVFAARAGKLYDLTGAIDDVLRSDGRNEAAMLRVTELMEELGRAWESFAWAATSAETFPQSAWPRQAIERILPQLGDGTPATLASHNLALRYDYSDLPGVAGLIDRLAGTATRAVAADTTSAIRFEERTDVGIDLVYDNGGDLSTKGTRMFEQTGGGVAVLDYDFDGWPDLYLTQGSKWKQGDTQPTTSPEMIDRLYRNDDGRSFIDVTTIAGLGDPGFGQGSAVGDFDGDGFPDLYVANIGHNRLYRNNGDGTFADVTEQCGLAGDTWTASCVIVDLNADGHPDLFDATYLTGSNVYTEICQGRGCSPKVFSGPPDRLHLSRGDGTFAFVPDATPVENSKGLGVVALDVETRGRPSLFISNDQVPNHYLRNLPSDDASNIRLQEEGFATGLAFNEDGLASACMGIATDDVDGNGLPDFYVTNFQDESNTLYLQDAPGLFLDATNPAGLRAPSFEFVSWGTQFLDADLDGHPDLVVVNGHIDDYRDEGGRYQMRPQFFRNTGGGRFIELPAEQAGEYFGRRYLGRGLARLDWNRDGLMEFAVSNIGDPASLMTNHSTGVGRFLNVRLHATRTARDAIGSVVTATVDGRTWTKQLVAGDGFMASNERVLQFGLGDATSVTELRIEWPSGETTTLENLPVDVTVEVTENAGWGTLWRGTQPESLPMP